MRRGIFASALLGMGLTEETLECDTTQITYSGIEKRFWIWRLTKVTKTAKLRDVCGIHEEQVTHPFLWLMVIISVISSFAEFDRNYNWFNFGIWKLPLLWLGALGHNLGSSWIIIHLVVAAVWLSLYLYLKRTFLILDVGELSAIRIRIDGVSQEKITDFKQQLYLRWSANKTIGA